MRKTNPLFAVLQARFRGYKVDRATAPAAPIVAEVVRVTPAPVSPSSAGRVSLEG